MDEHGNVMTLKLADFGLACEVDEPLWAVCGTPTYVAPEILMETGYGLKVRLFSCFVCRSQVAVTVLTFVELYLIYSGGKAHCDGMEYSKEECQIKY